MSDDGESSASSSSQGFSATLQGISGLKSPALRVRTSDLGIATACRTSKSSSSASRASKLDYGPLGALTDFVQAVEIYNVRQTQVIVCLTKLTRVPVAVKISVKATMTPRQKLLVEKEIRLSTRLSAHTHPGLVQLLNSFEDDYHYYQVLEHCASGNLYEALQTRGAPFSEHEVCSQVLIPLLDSLAFIHSQGLVHRDVKLENLLISDSGVKLADFGLAVDLNLEEPRICVGTIDYNAPEVAGQPNVMQLEELDPETVPAYDEKVDIWAVGVVAYELLLGRAPFYMPDAADTKALIQEGTLPGFLGFLSSDCTDFLQAALRKNPEERPSAADLLDHPWLAFRSDERRTHSRGNLTEKPTAATTIRSLDFSGNRGSSAVGSAGVATFASPNPSLSPRLGSWKISTHAAGFKLDNAALLDIEPRRRGSWLHRELELQDDAEDIRPRDAAAPIRTLSYVRTAPELEELREEALESALGAPAELNPSSETSTLPLFLTPLQLRRTASTGKSRFA